MKVSELIVKLTQLNPNMDMEVMINNPYSGDIMDIVIAQREMDNKDVILIKD